MNLRDRFAAASLLWFYSLAAVTFAEDVPSDDEARMMAVLKRNIERATSTPPPVGAIRDAAPTPAAKGRRAFEATRPATGGRPR